MVSILVFRWPKPLFFMVLGAHGNICTNNELIESDPSTRTLSAPTEVLVPPGRG